MPSKPRKTKRVRTDLPVTILGIDSSYDSVTTAARGYRDQHVYPYLDQQGFEVKKFQGPLARRHYVSPKTSKPEVTYITGVGHGLADLYTGDYGDVIWRVGQYHPDEVNGKVIHLLSCETARQLGPDFVLNGCRAFFGYDEDFTFVPVDEELFFECDSEIDRAFADGLTAQQAFTRVKALFDQKIADLQAAGKLYTATLLEYDRDHLRCPSAGGSAWGDPTARLS